MSTFGTAELDDLGEAIGLLHSGGGFDAGWFSNPLDKLESLLKNGEQRAAFLRFLDAMLPPAPLPGRPDGEKWHPLLGPQERGNLYLTVDDTGSGLVAGLGSELASGADAAVQGRLRCHVPLISAAADVELVLGTSAEPIEAELRIETGWVRGAGAGGHAIGLAAIVARASIVPDPTSPQFHLLVVLEQLDLGSGPADKLLDVAHLGHEAPDLLAGLLKAVLAEAGADPTVTILADHLLALFGLDEADNIPAFPFGELTAGPQALQQWLAQLIGATDGAAPTAGPWLEQLAGLLDGDGAFSGSGTDADPWRVDVLPLDGLGHLSVTLAAVDGHARFGVAGSLGAALGAGEPQLDLVASCAIADVPLDGTGAARVLPQASVRAAFASGGAGPLVDDPNVRVGSLQGGVVWNGSALRPTLEAVAVRFRGQTYPLLDLTNVDSVEQAAAGAVAGLIKEALGADAGRRLAALAGLVAPEDPANPGQPLPGWPHALDLARLVSDPVGAIAAYHRAVLLDAAHGWKELLRELGALIGLAGAPAGTGTAADPWRSVVAAPDASTALELVAWNDQTGGAAEPQQLRLGLRFRADHGSAELSWTGEALAFDLPAAGHGRVALVGAQRLRFGFEPALDTEPLRGVHVHVGAAEATAQWAPGAPLGWLARVTDLTLEADGDALTVHELHLPPAGGFDIGDAAATAAALGLTPTALEDVLRWLLTLLAAQVGQLEYVVAGLVGLHHHLSGLAEDAPTIVDPADPGRLLRDPLGALRAWLGRMLTHTGADGNPTAAVLLDWVAAAAGGLVPADAHADAPLADVLDGGGTYEDPWRLGWPGDPGDRTTLDLWLEPAGPPVAWAAGLATLAGAAEELDELAGVLRLLAWLHPPLAALASGRSADDLASSLQALATHLASGDGVVALESQSPDVFGWEHGTQLTAAHPKLPEDGAAIAQVLAQVEALVDGPHPRLALLLGPAFTDSTSWATLLAAPARQGTVDPGAHFDLRVPGIDPLTRSLADVRAVADYYTADLADDGSGDVSRLATQIDRIAQRLDELRPGVQITIVAHSTAGLAARAYAAAHQDRVRGLVTLGTPHLGAALPFLDDPPTGDGVRLGALLAPLLPASPLRDALEHLLVAVDGYAPQPDPAVLPQPRPYPAASFSTTAPFNLGDVPVLALPSGLPDDTFERLRDAVVALANQVAAGARPAPTHLAGGVSIPFDLGASAPNAVDAQARVRLALFRAALQEGAPTPARPAHQLRAEVRLFREGDWLFGAAGPSELDGRAREALLHFTMSTPTGASVGVELREAAWRGPTVPRLDETDPRTASALGAALDAVFAAGAELGSATSQLLAALQAIDLAATDANGVTGFSADAWAALRTDPVGFLRTRVPAALALEQGWLSSTGAPTGPWRWQPAGSIFALELGADRRLAVTAEVDPDGDGLRFGARIETPFPAFAPTVELTLALGVVTARLRSADGTLTLAAPPWLDELRLVPAPNAAELGRVLNETWPRLLFSGALGPVLSAVAPGAKISLVERLLRAPGEFLLDAAALGRPDGGIDGAKVEQLLQALNGVAGLPAGPGLQLPGDLSITAGGGASAGDPLHLSVATTAPVGGILGLALTADVDTLRHVAPGGTISVSTPLAGTWPHVTITFGVGPTGVTLAVAPQGVPPIQLLPTFSGLRALRGAAEALLPSVLDSTVATFGAPRPAWLTAFLQVATDLHVYDDAGGFTAHATELRAMLEGDWFDTFDAGKHNDVAAAGADLVRLIPGLPGTVAATGGLVQWTLPIGGGGEVSAGVGWGDGGPALRLGAQHVQPGNAPLRADVGVTAATTGLDVALALAVELDAIGVPLAPKLAVDLDTGATTRFRVRILPLADGSGDGPLTIRLAPDVHVDAGAATAEQVLERWALPLAVQVAVQAAHDMLPSRLWTSGPTLEDALKASGILTAGSAVATPLPDLWHMLTGWLAEAASLLDLPVGTLHFRLVDESRRVGVELTGHQDIPVGDLELSLRLGAPASWGAAEAEGLKLLLLDVSGGAPELDVTLEFHGVGLGLARSDGDALVAEDVVHVQEARAYLFLDLDTKPSLQANHFGAGLELVGFGIPLGPAISSSSSGSNPVAANLLRSNGSGDTKPVKPASDLDVWYWDNPASTGGPLHVLIGGQSGVVFIPVHAAFGPIFIDQIGIGLTDTNASLLVDGGVSIAGLTAQVDDLEVDIPFAHLSDPSQWTLDLKGLAVGYHGPSIAIAGGLVKFTGPPIEYDGMLLVKIASIGAIVIGSYAVVQESGGEFDSIAIFGGVFVPIGIPPIIDITGLGLGLGYNRRLVVPDDLNQIPHFFLVEALDRPEELANNPMQALFSLREQVPPARGALWLAAGLRGTSFEIVNVTAVLYVALDGGVEVGLLGVARMELPPDGFTLVSIELALKVRFSTAEGLFSVQAQLTDNSWLLSRDCQLTGGFAYFMWFKKSQFLLTMGGYHPAFQPLPEYPVVPRLGYRWNFLDVVQIKGESYFALTNTCVMAGTRMEATYGPDWIQLWFTMYCDILVSWEPFHYDIRIGAAVGARLRIEICFFGCVHIEISVSVGGEVRVVGPPLHGTLTVDLGVTSASVDFGDDPQDKPPALHWDAFVLKYVRTNDPSALPVAAQVLTGLMPAEPAGAPVAPGTQTQPWRLAAEWSFQTETRMPVRGFALQTNLARSEAQMAGFVFGRYDNLAATFAFDIAPMDIGHQDLTTLHRVVLARKPEGGGDFVTLVPRGSPELPDDASFILDERQFRVEPVIVQVSEATYHSFPDHKPPAAANTLPALGGLRLFGIASLHNESQPIPIGKLVDATNYRPLPFARRVAVDLGDLIQAGVAAEAFAQLSAGVSGRRLLTAYADVLSGTETPFAELRVKSGLPDPGYLPIAVDSLLTRRSSPPQLSSLATGMTLREPALDVPAAVDGIPAQVPVELAAPRLRAVMQQQPAAATAAAPTLRTTLPRGFLAAAVDAELAVLPRLNVERDLVRSVAVPGARLVRQPTTPTPRPTRLAGGIRTIRHPDLGTALGRGTAQAVAGVEEQATGNGALVRSGVVQLWDVPGGGATLLLSEGDMPVRIVQLGRAGGVLHDRELPDADGAQVPLAPDCAMVAIGGLGRLAVGEQPGEGFAAVTSAAAPAGRLPTVGWQIGSHVAQVGPSTLLARGSSLSLSKRVASVVRRQDAAVGLVELTRAILDQAAVETRLPFGIGAVGVLLDLDPGAVVRPETVAVHADVVGLTSPPVRVDGGNRMLFLYDVVAEQEPEAAPPESIAVTVGALAGLRLAGVVGLVGSASTWGQTLNGSLLEQLVPDEPLAADGSVRVRFRRKEA